MKEPKIRRKFVTITKADFVKSNKTTNFSKFKKLIANIFKIKLYEKYHFMYKIWYNGKTILRKDMLVVSNCGIRFIVIDEKSKMAILVTVDDMFYKPVLNGLLTIIDRKQEEQYAKEMQEYISFVEKGQNELSKNNLKVVK